MDIDPVKSQVSPAEKSLEIHIGDVDIIDVDVDDQAKTTALGALSASAAADALASLSQRQKKDANGTQEIEIGDVLEVMQKPAQKAPASTRSVPRPGARVAPPSDQVVHGIVVPPPPSAPQMVLPSVMVRNTPVPPDATMELAAADVLEEVVVQNSAAQVAAAPVAPVTAPVLDARHAFATAAPMSPPSNSDIVKTHVLPPTPRQPLAQFPLDEKPLAQFSVDEEVAPFASDTVDIPLNRVAGMPLWLQIKDKPQLMIVGGAVAACLAIGALAFGMHLHSASADTSAQTANANAATGPAMHKEDPAAAIPPPPSQPDVQTVSVDELKRAPSQSAPAPSPVQAAHPWRGASAPAHTSHAHVAASHHADSAPAPKAHAQKPEGFGLVRTWIAARGEPISVDGKAVGVAPSPVRVTCGPHTIAIGHEIVKADVPCDGAITVGSPDHKQ